MTSNCVAAIGGLSDAAVQHHGPAYLRRGGSVGRAEGFQRRGWAPEAAAAEAARLQGKGHAAELRLAAEMSTAAGLFADASVTRPNRLANALHIDVEVMERGRCTNGAQVGVGSPQYLRQKALRSAAPQVVINCEAREIMVSSDGVLCARTSDRMSHRNLRSSTLSEERATDDARLVLARALAGSAELDFLARCDIALDAGARSSLGSAASSILIDLVEQVWRGQAIDGGRLVQRALSSAARGFCATGIQTYALTSQFLTRAGDEFRGHILRRVSQGAAWAGFVADFIVATALDVVRCAKDEISFDDLLRRAGVTACAAGGAALCIAAVLPVVAGLHPLVQLLMVGLGGYLGNRGGRALGEALFEGPPAAAT